jgi:zinc transport system substrate-binding protein
MGGEGRDGRGAAGRIEVIASILPLAHLVENIGGERVDVTVMVPPGADPHTFAPTPGQMRAVTRAKMYVKAGSGLVFECAWMDRIRAQNEGMLIVDSSDGIEGIKLFEMVRPRPCCDPLGGQGHGDNHRKGPPYMFSPRNVRIMMKNIYEGLIKIDPEYADFYRENLERYLREPQFCAESAIMHMGNTS